LVPAFVAAYLYFEVPADQAAWGSPLGEAIGGLLLHALLFAPLYFAPFYLQWSRPARLGAACLLLPAIAMQGVLVLVGTLGLRLHDGFEAWTMYLVTLISVIVLVAAIAALLWPGHPPSLGVDQLTRVASPIEPARPAPAQ
jgi:hypothetical protein